MTNKLSINELEFMFRVLRDAFPEQKGEDAPVYKMEEMHNALCHRQEQYNEEFHHQVLTQINQFAVNELNKLLNPKKEKREREESEISLCCSQCECENEDGECVCNEDDCPCCFDCDDCGERLTDCTC